jgi:hypothetical protein
MKASDFGGSVPEFVGRWMWSGDGEQYEEDFATMGEAVAAGREMHPGETISVGVGAELELHPHAAVILLERVAMGAYDSCGDVAAGYLSNVSVAAAAQLDAALEKALGEWLTKHDLWPDFSVVKGVRTFPPGSGVPDTVTG